MNDPLKGKKILLGIGGGIAAYKIPELVRALKKSGAEIQVVLTEAATHFVTPLTLQALSGRPVRADLLDPASEMGMDHIALARWADVLLIAPATADLLARLAQGMANDLLSTLALASERRPLLAPAMNQQMWLHPATQRNLAQLRRDGACILGPESGDQACGENGPGRMLDVQDILAHLQLHLAPKYLSGKRALVTAGTTWEAIDPVRGLSNRSSGLQGFAIARALAEAGAQVRLLSGPTCLSTPLGVLREKVESAADLLHAVENHLSDCDIFISCAAVADHRPAQTASAKIAKQAFPKQLALCTNPDILAHVAQHDHRPDLVIGFAAQTHDTHELAMAKRIQKKVDIILANNVGEDGIGFGAEMNHLYLIDASGMHDLGKHGKLVLARLLVERLPRYL